MKMKMQMTMLSSKIQERSAKKARSLDLYEIFYLIQKLQQKNVKYF